MHTPLRSLALSLAVTLVFVSHAAAEDGKWQPLFDGQTLDGWVQRGGKAKYTVEDGEIVGTSVPNTSNSFLCTNKDYGNFVLELEFQVDPKLNSGVQFRSECFDEPKELKVNVQPKDPDGQPEEKTVKVSAGRVHGYQCEIDPSDRAWTGGIYDEGRRAWIANLKDNDDARAAFHQGQWNKFRIECRGDSIKTWINDVPAADLKDDLTPKGFIALQVHGVGKEKTPRIVRFRNIRIIDLDNS